MKLDEEIRKDIVTAIDGKENVFSIDSMSVKVCQNSRAAHSAMGKDDSDTVPQWGGVLCIVRDVLLWI